MTLAFTETAQQQYKKLPSSIQNKADKQFFLLLQNYRHPSIRARKMYDAIFEGRVDYNYRFTFVIKQKVIYVLSIGPHDKGLGKK